MPHIDEEFTDLASDLLRRAQGVALLALDVDGVQTDGGLYIDAAGAVTKRFDVQDGLGVLLARQAGIRVAVVTGQELPSVAERMRMLHIEDYYPGARDKVVCVTRMMQKYQLASEQVAFLGDDWVDLPVMRQVGLPLAVRNAQPEVKSLARYVTRAHGGHGAVRETVRLLLHSRGVLASMAQAWQAGATI